MDAILTVAIPTYNRPVQLKNTLSMLYPQIERDARVRLMILDNHSDVPVANVLADMGLDRSERIRVVRHPANIGLCANIMRCFELCETEWLWTVSDDDKPAPDAVQTILADACSEHVFAFYNFPEFPLPQKIPNGRLTGKTLSELAAAVGHALVPLTLISASIYRVGVLREHLSKGYASMTAMVPFLNLVFAELERDRGRGGWLLSEKTICHWQPPARDQVWMRHSFFMGIPVGCVTLTQESGMRLFRTCLQRLYWHNPEYLLLHLIDGFQFRAAFSVECRYYFGMLKAAYMPSLFAHPLAWCKWHVVILCSYFPAAFTAFVLFACRMLGQPAPFFGSRKRD